MGRIRKQIARKKRYVKIAHNIYGTSTENMNGHLRSKRKVNDLIDFHVPLFNGNFRHLVSDWGMQSSKLDSRFETKARSL